MSIRGAPYHRDFAVLNKVESTCNCPSSNPRFMGRYLWDGIFVITTGSSSKSRESGMHGQFSLLFRSTLYKSDQGYEGRCRGFFPKLPFQGVTCEDEL